MPADGAYQEQLAVWDIANGPTVREQAKQTVFGGPPAAKVVAGRTEGESVLLRQAGAVEIDDAIRETVNRESAQLAAVESATDIVPLQQAWPGLPDVAPSLALTPAPRHDIQLAQQPQIRSRDFWSADSEQRGECDVYRNISRLVEQRFRRTSGPAEAGHHYICNRV